MAAKKDVTNGKPLIPYENFGTASELFTSQTKISFSQRIMQSVKNYQTIAKLSWVASPTLVMCRGLIILPSTYLGLKKVHQSYSLSSSFFSALTAAQLPQSMLQRQYKPLVRYTISSTLAGGVTFIENLLEIAVKHRIIFVVENNYLSALAQGTLSDIESYEVQRLAKDIQHTLHTVEQSWSIIGSSLRDVMTILSHCKTLSQIDKNYWFSSLIAISSGLCSTFFTYQNNGSYVQNSYITSLKKELIHNFFIDPDFVSDRLILGLTDPLLQEYQDMSAQVSATESRANVKEFIDRTITDNLYKASSWGNLCYLAYRCARRTIASSDAAQLYLSLQVISSRISELSGGIYRTSYYNAPLQKYEKLIALSEKFANYRKPVKQLANPQKITVDNVSFSYPDSDKSALTEISLEIFRGQIIALVGENGSGKTTLAKLIAGLYLPSSGNIFWDDINIKDINLHALYKHIAIISQDPAQWPLTLENNILIGKPYQHDKLPYEWLKAIIESGADEVIDSLPDQEKTLLTHTYSQGQDLSRGQWQRIAIARALYRDADIIIADEPTSALDAKAEAKIFAGIQKSFAQKTSQEKIGIIITHRLANIASVDRIIVLDNGKIVEQGTHSELMRKKGKYYELYSIQAQAYLAMDNP